MAFVTWRLDRYARAGDTWSSTYTTLTDTYDTILSIAVGPSKDTFNLKLANFNNAYTNYFQSRDKIIIYRAVNALSVNTTTDVLMSGAVNSIPTEHSGTTNETRVTGYNFSEAVAEAIVPLYDAVDKTPAQIIEDAINNARLANPNLCVTWDATNKTTKVDGSAFPTYSKRYSNIPLRQVIEENSSATKTFDGSYKYWVDTSNKLKWVSVNQASSTSLTFNSATDEYVSYKDSKDLTGVKNYIIMKGGLDPANKPIQIPYQDYTSISKHGNKFYFAISEKNSAENLVKQDVGNQYATSKYPTAYPFTTTWYKANTNVRVTVNSNTEYLTAIRTEIKERLLKEAQAIAESTSKGKLKVDVTFLAGTKTWQLNDRILCTIASLSSTPKILRLVEIQYTSDIDTFSLEEDIGSL